MAERIAWMGANPMAVIPPGEEQVDGQATTSWSLAPAGDPVVVIDSGAGGRPALFYMLNQARHQLEAFCLAEHENALHHRQYEPGCPACAEDADAPCPACGEPGECELAPCGDPSCDARDCERHDSCETQQQRDREEDEAHALNAWMDRATG